MKKIVSFAEMQRLESLGKQDLSRLMEAAGDAVASLARDGKKRATLIVGKGNNGGDAFAAGVKLMERGWHVTARLVVPIGQCSFLSQKWGALFFSRGGKEERLEAPFEEGLLIDGIYGIGFRGEVPEKIKGVIEAMNGSLRPILAIDVPSGFLVRAQTTVTLGLPKEELLNQMDQVGRLFVADIGLFDGGATESGWLFEASDVRLPALKRTRHKYEAGYLMGYGGAPHMTGAAKLSAHAALRVGAGIVRLFHPKGSDFSGAIPEVIAEPFDGKRWETEERRAQAAFVGPGLVLKKLPSLQIPVVLDGGALAVLKSLSLWPKDAVITPHGGELKHLGDPRELCERYGAVVVAKGMPTRIFVRGKKTIYVAHGDPGMATAGSGDVLTGLIGGLLAQGHSCQQAATDGVMLHALSGETAAAVETSYGMLASHLIHYLPYAIRACFPI